MSKCRSRLLAAANVERRGRGLARRVGTRNCEIGQAVFAAAAFAILYAASRVTAWVYPQRVQRIAAYAVGILASYWMFDRIG